MHLPTLFNLGTQINNDGLYTQVLYFRDQIQDGGLADILLLKCVPNNFSDIHGPILFKLGTSTVHDGIHVYLTLFCNLIEDGQLVDWWPFSWLKNQPGIEHVLNDFTDMLLPIWFKHGTDNE